MTSSQCLKVSGSGGGGVGDRAAVGTGLVLVLLDEDGFAMIGGW